MSRIVVLGDLNLDVLARLPADLPHGGEVRTSVESIPGGSAGNFARAAACEGVNVIFIGCVGNDLVGELLVRSLIEQGIDVQVKHVELPTGMIVALQYGENSTMLCSRGANDGLDPSWIRVDFFHHANHLHLSGYSFLSPAQFPAVKKAMRIAQQEGMSISVSPPPANLIDSFGVTSFLEAIAKVNFIFPSLREGKLLSGKETPEEVVTALAEKFTAGALTLEGEGSLAWRGDKRDRCQIDSIKALDTTGAGDAFAAGFIVTYLKSRDLSAANRRGNEVAYFMLRGKAVKI
jgi:sugar/nucleoside kinase (ribokinase family)